MSQSNRHEVRLDAGELHALLASLVGSGEPGVAVAVSHRRALIFEHAVGLSDLGSAEPLSTRTGMAVGSCTKHLTCLAFLLLCERGLASVDDEIGKYLPEVHPCARPATVSQLMGHISGLRDAAELSMLFDGFESPIPFQAILALYRDLGSTDAAPGERWSYNNGGYLLLSAILERAYDAPLEAIFRRQVFEPAGLADTYLQRFDHGAPPGRARLYRKCQAKFVETARSIEGLGQGGVTSTAADLLRWLGQFDAPAVGRPQSWTFLRSPMRLRNAMQTAYAAGLRVGHYRGLPVLHHPGAVPGGNAQMLKAPGIGLDIVVLANRQDLSAIDIANRILDIAVSGLAPKPQAAPAGLLDGLFRSPRTGRTIRFKTRRASQRLVLDGTELPASIDRSGALRPLAGGMLRPERILPDPAGEDRLTFEQFGEVETLSRVQPAKEIASYEQRTFRVPDTGLSFAFGKKPGRARAMGRTGHADYGIVPIGRELWELHARGAFPIATILAIDAGGTATLTNQRVRALRLEPAEQPS